MAIFDVPDLVRQLQYVAWWSHPASQKAFVKGTKST
jgi:hypothetical protein